MENRSPLPAFFRPWPRSTVFRGDPAARSQPIPSGDSGFAAAKQELAAALEKADEEERRQITEPEESREPNPWLRRVGWASHLAGLDRKEMRELVRGCRSGRARFGGVVYRDLIG